MRQSQFNPNEQVDCEIIIGTRNEGSSLLFTIHSLIEELESTPYTWRILVCNNGDTDYSSKYLLETRDGIPSPRGLITNGFVKVYYYPFLANVGARDWMVRQVCTAKYIFFADAHMIISRGSMQSMVETLEKHQPSMVHSTVDYLGAHDAKQGKQYSIKFGEKGVYGTWTNMKADIEGPMWIGSLGHCFFVVKREDYIKIGGYNHYLREYGGGETSYCLASWMLGNGCMVDQNARVYHSMFGRGYSYDSLNLVHNYFLATYLIAGEKYSKASLMSFFQQKPPETKPVWMKLYNEAIKEAGPHRKFILANQHTSFEDVLGLNSEPDCDGSCRTDKVGSPHVKRPWDKKNDELYGKHLSFVTEFELKEKDGKVMIGNLEITDPDALEIYRTIS